MSNELWRANPEYLSLLRTARQYREDYSGHLVLSDWLEENDHPIESWIERLWGQATGKPSFDPDTKTIRVGEIHMMQGSWRRLINSPPGNEILLIFDRDVRAYQYLRQYQGRCGLDLGQSNWSSITERNHLLAIPRLEMLACELAPPSDWDWITEHLPNLTHLEVKAPMIPAKKLADLKRLPNLKYLTLFGNAASDTRAVDTLPQLLHLSLGPFSYEAKRLLQLAPQLESLHADPTNFGEGILWPQLKSFQMRTKSGPPLMETEQVMTLTRHSLLERIHIVCGRVANVAIKALAALPQLQELKLRFHYERISSLKPLAKAPALESLEIQGPLTDNHLKEIAKVHSLRILSLGRVEGDGSILNTIAELQNLEELSLRGEIEDGKELIGLTSLPRLLKLDLEHFRMPSGIAKKLKESCPPWIECVLPSVPTE